MKRHLFLFLTTIVALVASCSKEATDYSQMRTPEIDFVLSDLPVDLNKADNLPIVAVIFSEAGLNSLDIYLKLIDGSETLYKSITEFYDARKHSIKETPVYTEQMAGVRLMATDRGGRVETKSMNFTITPFQEPPTVVFDPEEIRIDERQGVIIPRTTFIASASGMTKLTKLTAVLYSATGRTTIVSEDFTLNDDQPTSYAFDELIEYKDGDRSLQVTATDLYNKVTISALPINYIAIPAPMVTERQSRIIADINATQQIRFDAISEAGIAQVRIVKNVKTTSTEVLNKTYNNVLTMEFREPLLFDDDKANSLTVTIIDKNNKSTQYDISTIIALKYISDYKLGGQYFTKGYAEDKDNILHIFSVAKMSGITLQQAYDNRADGDFHFFMYDASGSCLRLNSWGQQENASQMTGLEYQDLPSVPSAYEWVNRNQTTLLELNPSVHGFDFDSATADDLHNFNGALITTMRITTPAVGKVYLVKTAASSSAGAVIGLIKIDNAVTPAITSVNTLPFENRYNYTKGTQCRRATVVTISAKFPK